MAAIWCLVDLPRNMNEACLVEDVLYKGRAMSYMAEVAKWLVESALVPLRFFQERCDEEFLWESEMIKIKAADLKSKEVTLLCQVPEASTGNASAATVGIIKSLIGHFDLDPNRVFDIVLECFELQLDNSVFVDLIPIFPKYTCTDGLYKLTALLVKKEFIDIDSIMLVETGYRWLLLASGLYSHLLPKDEDAFEHYNAFSAKRLDEQANKIGKINLAATGKDLMDDEKQGDVTVDLFAALDLETMAVAERSSELANNQTLGLLMGFLAVDDWFHAHQLLERLSPLNPVEHIQICNGIFSNFSAHKLVYETQISTAGVFSGSGADLETGTSPLKSFIDLPKELFEMLASAGPYLYRDTLLLQKTSRVLRAYYLCALELVRDGDGAFSSHSVTVGDRNPRLHLKDARLRIEEALGTCLLPSLQLIPANPAVGQEIWELMSLLPYELDTRRILKRLAKENLKQLGRMVAKLAHANPMTVLRTIVHQIEAYRDMIAPVVDAFKYLTQLEYDILEYVVFERLAQAGREKLKDDGLNLSDWLQSLASFWGHLYESFSPSYIFDMLISMGCSTQFAVADYFLEKLVTGAGCSAPGRFGLLIGSSACLSCVKVPINGTQGLFQYLVNQLKKGNGIELVLLQELIQQMANVQYTENMTEDQLDAMAGSDTLRYQATSFGITRNNKALIKSTNRLRDSLLPKDEPKLAIPLLLLIAQHRSVVVIQANVPYIKMVCEQFDRCHGTLLQYVDFLCSAVTPTSTYAMLIPTLDELVHQYHLDPEVAFLIYRPVMRLFRCQNTPSSFWPLECNEAAYPATAEKELESSDLSTTLILDLGSSCKPISQCCLQKRGIACLLICMRPSGVSLYMISMYPEIDMNLRLQSCMLLLKLLKNFLIIPVQQLLKGKKDKERIQESLDRLTLEFQKHEEHVESVRRRLAHEKDTWLSSCPDTLKINMEFLQRCIFPRCTFSMPDAVYCANFVNTLHSLGTPFFNTVNHIDVLICKTLQPMICCCTEYEVGRLGRFLFETLKTAYHWKSDESIYEKECGNMPGFAVYYRYPNSQRVTYGQFIKMQAHQCMDDVALMFLLRNMHVHWKWSQRITRLLIQCLESTEYMEIRNALIMLTKISSVFPVTRKSGINLEKRVAKIKSDEREDLKVLATGVAAALAARKPSWVTDEEFGMGYLDIKPAPGPASKSLSANAVGLQNGAGLSVSQAEQMGGRTVSSGSLHSDSGNLGREPRRIDVGSINGSDQSSLPSTGVQSGISCVPRDNLKQVEESANKQSEENSKVTMTVVEPEVRPVVKRSAAAGSLAKQAKQDLSKDEDKSGKAVGRTSGSSSAEITNSKSSDSRVYGGKDEGTEYTDVHKQPTSRSTQSPRQENLTAASKSGDKPHKRLSPAEEHDRLNKRRKGEIDSRDIDGSEVRLSEKERSSDVRALDKLHVAPFDKTGSDDKPLDRAKEKTGERYDRDYRERLERPEKSRGDDLLSEKLRDRSLERHGRERSVDRVQERGADRNFDRLAKDERNKDDRSKVRYGEASVEKSHVDDRFHGQGLPPPPPLPPHVVPQSVSSGRRDEDADRRFGNARHTQKLSPRHEERERRRSEENASALQDDTKRRREDEFRDRKRDERDALSIKGAYAIRTWRVFTSLPAPPPVSINLLQSHDGRDRGDRKGVIVQRPGYAEDPGLRAHSKEAASKATRRDADPYPYQAFAL
ncbi:hypothetical protein DH2020_020557 [Rehmannia glutinosa]|uniref:THO complex subunit 2 n=1 Tax=Rehmannia glutinosa TaxID=99300 RepID=A0ABR0WIK6_REHGL